MRASSVLPIILGATIAARRLSMKTTTIISISVKPFSYLLSFTSPVGSTETSGAGLQAQ